MEESLSDVIKILPEPIVLIDADGEILIANPAFYRVLSNTGESLAGVRLAEISPDSPEKISLYLQNCARSRQMVIGALSLRNANSEILQYRCEGAVLEPANADHPAKIFLRFKPKETTSGKFILLSQKIDELNREIRERKAAEDKSKRLYLEATEANRLKDEFLATVSHELRTPLSSILGWTTMLRANTLEAKQREKALETIQRNARSQVQLIEDLLDVSRIITGKLRLDVLPVDIVSVIESAVETVRPTAENKGVRLQVVIDRRAATVAGDAERLQQAIWNLLANAVKFTPKNGRVQLRLERVNSHIEIIVSDTGTGIESDFLPYVFERFQQADMSRTRKFGGLGLGLSITRHLIELHGGTIHAFSEGLGKGATFTVKLPLNIFSDGGNFADNNGSRTHPAVFKGAVRLDPPPELKNLRLLIVDDSPDAREMLQTLLENCGINVRQASSAAAALEKLQAEFFDILISDVGMPEEDGYSLITKVRALPDADKKEIGAIALTAHTSVAERIQLLNAGFDFHIAKPFEPGELMSVIGRLSRRKKQNS